MTVETYPDDLPLPSYLVLGWIGTEREKPEPVHVVAADDDARHHGLPARPRTMGA